MALVAVEQRTEQSDTPKDAPHDDVDEDFSELLGLELEICDAKLLSSSLELLGFSLLPGVFGS